MISAWLFIVAMLPGQDVAPTQLRTTAYARIDAARRLAADARLLDAVRQKNARGETPAAIAAIDRAWRAGHHMLQQQLTSDGCAVRLRELIADDPLIVEAILMDEQGALVCSSVITSDYFQGDEPKWSSPCGKARASSWTNRPTTRARAPTPSSSASRCGARCGRSAR